MKPLERRTHFHTTSWTLIEKAGRDSQVHTKLVLQYWPPIYSFLHSQGKSKDEAVELTQAFIADRLMEPAIFGKVDPSRGRFRNYLLRSLKNFLIDQVRREKARNRIFEVGVGGLGNGILDSIYVESANSHDPASRFEREWARTVFRIALERLESECLNAGQQLHWRVFELVHADIFEKGKAGKLSHSRIASEAGARDAAHVSVLLNTVRRKFKRILKSIVAETLADEADAEIEIEYLMELLS